MGDDSTVLSSAPREKPRCGLCGKTKRRKELTVLEPVEPLIHEIRGERVMLNADLARIYGVETRTLNQAVRRNMANPGDDAVGRDSVEPSSRAERASPSGSQ